MCGTWLVNLASKDHGPTCIYMNQLKNNFPLFFLHIWCKDWEGPMCVCLQIFSCLSTCTTKIETFQFLFVPKAIQLTLLLSISTCSTFVVIVQIYANCKLASILPFVPFTEKEGFCLFLLCFGWFESRWYRRQIKPKYQNHLWYMCRNGLLNFGQVYPILSIAFFSINIFVHCMRDSNSF